VEKNNNNNNNVEEIWDSRERETGTGDSLVLTADTVSVLSAGCWPCSSMKLCGSVYGFIATYTGYTKYYCPCLFTQKILSGIILIREQRLQ
jgi:hypothetical protein